MNGFKAFFSEVFRHHTEDDAEAVVIAGAPGTIPDPATLSSACPRPWLYTRVLAFFVLTTALLFLVSMMTDATSFTNVMAVGAFAVPFTTLVLLFEFNVFRNISFYTILKALFIGGSLSLIAIMVLPTIWFGNISETSDAFVAGIGEEIGKMLVVYWILKRNRAYPYILNGILIGAAVGTGFSVFETAGYATNAFLFGDNTWIGKDSLINLGLRNVLSPGGHVVWAAMSGAGLLLAMRREPLSPAVFGRRAFWGIFLVPIALHVAWDLPLFESAWAAIGFCLLLVLLAWLFVAWLLRRGLREVDEARAAVPWRDDREMVAGAPAGPWSRWAARSVDLLLESVLVFNPLVSITLYFWADEAIRVLWIAVFGMVFLPLALALEAVVYELFGTTVGKWLFSMRILDASGRSLSSGAYARRLVRLWWSGLGLGVAAILLFMFFRQHGRVSKGRPASYDERAGTSVVRGKIRPLRWLAALPFAALSALLAVAFVALVVLGSRTELDAGDPAAGPALSGQADPRVAALVAGSGLSCKTLDDGLVSIPFTLGGGFLGFGARTQNCFVLPESVEADGGPFLFLFSPVENLDGADAADLEEILVANATRSGSIWTAFDDLLVLRVLVPLDVAPEIFRRAANDLAKEADTCEKELTGKNEF